MTVIKHGNILQHILLCCTAGLVVPPVDSLLFEVTEKAFCRGIVETIAGSAHATHKAVYLQKLLILPAGILWSSLKVLSGRLSNTPDADFCIQALEAAIQNYGCPEIFNTDQGAQFTAKAWIGILKNHGIQISMDGKGRYHDNIFIERLWRTVKYERLYTRTFSNLKEVRQKPDSVV